MLFVKIQCPTCSKRSNLELSQDIRKNIRGITAINVIKDQICPHTFIVYLDNNLHVRDTLIADFTVELPQMELKQKKDEINIPNSDTIDVFLLKLNLLPNFLIFIIHGVFLKKKILFVDDNEILKNYYTNFFDFIFKDSFEIDITIEKFENYSKNMKSFKNYSIVLNKEEIIRDKEELLSSKKLKTERKIIQKFYDESDAKLSLIFLKNEVQKAFILSKTVADFFRERKEDKKIDESEIIDNLKKLLNVKVFPYYLDFLMEIVKNYFQIDVPLISKNIIELF